MICELCGEEVGPTDDSRPLGSGRAHRECLLRQVMGGIGHLEDHERWCIGQGDPDGGRSYRQSALEVDEWIASGGPV